MVWGAGVDRLPVPPSLNPPPPRARTPTPTPTAALHAQALGPRGREPGHGGRRPRPPGRHHQVRACVGLCCECVSWLLLLLRSSAPPSKQPTHKDCVALLLHPNPLAPLPPPIPQVRGHPRRHHPARGRGDLFPRVPRRPRPLHPLPHARARPLLRHAPRRGRAGAHGAGAVFGGHAVCRRLRAVL